MFLVVVMVAVIGVTYSRAARRLIVVFALAAVVVVALTNKFVAVQIKYQWQQIILNHTDGNQQP